MTPQLHGVIEPADRVTIAPNERFAVVGKSRSGKTTFGSVLSFTLVPDELIVAHWQVWVIDSKGDPKDIARLRKLGFVEGDVTTGLPKRQPRFFASGPPPGRLYFRLRDVGGATVVQQAQHLFRLAMARRRVLVNIDEYTQVIEGQRTCGRALDDLFTRGGGLGVGVIGNTQEPVLIPRKLLSQATHLLAFDLSFAPDIEYIQRMIPDYTRPSRDERHALWWLWLDGDAIPRYYPSLRAWRSQVVEGAT
jgi:hypothetical protein